MTKDRVPLIDELRGRLQIDQHDLDSALLEQPLLFDKVSSRVAKAISNRDSYKLERDKILAERDTYYRDKAAKDEARLSEKALSSLLDQDATALEVRQAYVDHCRNVDEWEGLKQSLNQRGYVLKDLVGLYIANYYQKNSGGPDRMSYARADKIREEAGRQREERLRPKKGVG